jgi:hypothetical protein
VNLPGFDSEHRRPGLWPFSGAAAIAAPGRRLGIVSFPAFGLFGTLTVELAWEDHPW